MAQSVARAHLISFLQALPEGRKCRGVHAPQWQLLLMANLGIHSFAEGLHLQRLPQRQVCRALCQLAPARFQHDVGRGNIQVAVGLSLSAVSLPRDLRATSMGLLQD